LEAAVQTVFTKVSTQCQVTLPPAYKTMVSSQWAKQQNNKQAKP
tara:strand:- start:226 stop:357 length:132 start_codon:yes stop_codon:yes gene_type:complete